MHFQTPPKGSPLGVRDFTTFVVVKGKCQGNVFKGGHLQMPSPVAHSVLPGLGQGRSLRAETFFGDQLGVQLRILIREIVGPNSKVNFSHGRLNNEIFPSKFDL